jgi:hypothetical protein
MEPLRSQLLTKTQKLFFFVFFGLTLGFPFVAIAQTIDCGSKSSGLHHIVPQANPNANCAGCAPGTTRYKNQQTAFYCDGGQSSPQAGCNFESCSVCKSSPPASFVACEGQYIDEHGNTINSLGDSCTPGRANECPHVTQAKCGDCPFYVKIVGGEICGDGVDNDKDGRVDEGCGGSQGGPCVGSPIHLATGNMFLKHTDFTLRTGSMPIYFTRTYNSNSHELVEHRMSRLGYGWRHNYHSQIILPNEGTNLLGPPTWYKILLGSRTLSFVKSGSNFIAQKGSGGYQLKENVIFPTGSNKQHWELTAPDGTRYLYSKDNPAAPTAPAKDTNNYRQLVKIIAPNGNYLSLSYRTHDGVQFSHGKYLRSKYLRSVFPYFKDHKSAGQGIVLQYIPYNGNWRISKIGRALLPSSSSTSSTPATDYLTNCT